MPYKFVLVAMSMIAAASAASAGQLGVEAGAPEAPAGARYCLWVEPITGTRIESIRCETRDGWSRLEIDVDKEWAKEGVRIIG